MKILVVGGTGIVGSAIVKELSPRHEVIVASRKNSDVVCDISSEESIKAMFVNVGEVDAVICAAGKAHFEDFSHMTTAKYQVGLNNKLMGQVNLVLIGSSFVKTNGSFTLISGVIGLEYIKTGSSAAMVNRALEGFVKGVYLEMPKGIRINIVCPTIVSESMPLYGSLFKGFTPVPVSTVATAFAKSVEGSETGKIYPLL
ncbi:MAG: short chain dehydrogenase [Rhabdochlamydiaceae bacterium]|jgi:NAD(P)-dependent dehydrogenase (short-subunit alcohol dehydrogenase family)